MTIIDAKRLERAEQFLWISARVLERVRFEQQFRGGPSEPVLSALAAYQNRDGGFGQALEPDFRGPVSQPLAALSALGVYDELNAFHVPQLGKLYDHFASIAAADGGVANVLANAVDYPRAPWWQPAAQPVPGSLLPTAAIAGLLHKHRVQHRWLEHATAFTWRALPKLLERIAAGGERLARLQSAYEARAVVTFLDHVPERERALQQASELGKALARAGAFALKPDAAAEAGLPLDFAPTPESVARRWFDDAIIEQHLDALIASQGEDGGFNVPWLIWTPITGVEWRGIQTVERLKTLRAYGRLG